MRAEPVRGEYGNKEIIGKQNIKAIIDLLGGRSNLFSSPRQGILSPSRYSTPLLQDAKVFKARSYRPMTP